MRIYTIDQLSKEDTARIQERLNDMELRAGIEGIYWLPVPADMLSPTQSEHRENCGPYCLALELDEQALHLELLVRGLGRISCQCVAFASVELRNHMIAFVEDMLRELSISF